MYSSLKQYGQSNDTVMTRYPSPSLSLPTQKTLLLDINYHLPQVSTIHSDVNYSYPKQSSIIKSDIHTDKYTDRDTSSIIFDKTPITKLLPVMNPQFNLREICKQCVLLEDHLTHDDKRCDDCCTKHFLTLEALAEEALTLDENGLLTQNVKTLPRQIRELQIMWLENPDKHHDISQKLRQIRKQFQQECFDVIKQNCSNSSCSIR